ncbi:unnamed protein product [Peronospora destructor]|uniref:Prenyltransferase alpha-alpha toroid domain-containing protein n=1 Tax=Peronospora destructor TaxID=86335 RepID=A0AAV0TQZ1_9STRA|nr:unnamed protein product [Peronospora destructor]
MERYRFKNDGLATDTSMSQEECESGCSLFFFPLLELPLHQQLQLQQLSFINTDLEPLLMREKHLWMPVDHGSSTGFFTLWIYWTHLPEEETARVIGTLKPFWNNDHEGGFGGGPKQLGHTATNYASCLTLALLGTSEAWEAVDRQKLYRFFLARKYATSGAFTAHDGGEADVRVTYCVISIASLHTRVVLVVNQRTKLTVDTHSVPLQHSTFSKQLIRFATYLSLLHWLANRQMPFEGGYQGRTNKLVDGCYSFWQGAVPALLAQVVRQRYGDEVPYQCHQENLQRYILLCGQEITGGLRDKPGKPRDHYHSCYCLSGLSVAQHGDGRGEPVVYGDVSNLMKPTHPAYNIGYDKAMKTIEYFKTKGPFQPE